MTDSANNSSKSSLKDDHIQRTVNQHRAGEAVNMKIISVSNVSPTVKHLVLRTTEKPISISFKAGQCVDMVIPGVETVGGFSMCSSPIHFNETGEMSFCVKDSDHPPATWVHNECKPGSTVSIRVGGDFFLDTADNGTAGKNILLVGGGVGINPLFSIITQLQDYRKTVGSYSSKSCLMYSAKTKAELFFMDSLNKFALEDHTFNVQYFITSEDEGVILKDPTCGQERIEFEYRRITKADVEKCLVSHFDLNIGSVEANNETLVYLCGPPPMIQHMQEVFKSLGIENVFLEKWW